MLWPHLQGVPLSKNAWSAPPALHFLIIDWKKQQLYPLMEQSVQKIFVQAA